MNIATSMLKQHWFHKAEKAKSKHYESRNFPKFADVESDKLSDVLSKGDCENYTLSHRLSESEYDKYSPFDSGSSPACSSMLLRSDSFGILNPMFLENDLGRSSKLSKERKNINSKTGMPKSKTFSSNLSKEIPQEIVGEKVKNDKHICMTTRRKTCSDVLTYFTEPTLELSFSYPNDIEEELLRPLPKGLVKSVLENQNARESAFHMEAPKRKMRSFTNSVLITQENSVRYLETLDKLLDYKSKQVGKPSCSGYIDPWFLHRQGDEVVQDYEIEEKTKLSHHQCTSQFQHEGKDEKYSTSTSSIYSGEELRIHNDSLKNKLPIDNFSRFTPKRNKESNGPETIVRKAALSSHSENSISDLTNNEPLRTSLSLSVGLSCHQSFQIFKENYLFNQKERMHETAVRRKSWLDVGVHDYQVLSSSVGVHDYQVLSSSVGVHDYQVLSSSSSSECSSPTFGQVDPLSSLSFKAGLPSSPLSLSSSSLSSSSSESSSSSSSSSESSLDSN